MAHFLKLRHQVSLQQVVFHSLHWFTFTQSSLNTFSIAPHHIFSHGGEVAPFKPGLLKMLEQAPAPVVPVAIGRMWGSAFSRKHQSWIKRLPLWDFGRPVFVRVGEPVPPQALDMDDLRGKVAELLGEQRQLSA